MLYFLPTCHSLLSFSHFTFARTRTHTLLLFVPLLDSVVVVVVTGTLVTFVVVVACKRSDKAKSQASKQKPAQVKKNCIF